MPPCAARAKSSAAAKFQVKSLGGSDGAQVADDVARDDAAEVETLAARDDGGQDLVRLGGGEDEDDVRRRFLQVLSSALKAAVESMWTSSTTMTR